MNELVSNKIRINFESLEFPVNPKLVVYCDGERMAEFSVINMYDKLCDFISKTTPFNNNRLSHIIISIKVANIIEGLYTTKLEADR